MRLYPCSCIKTKIYTYHRTRRFEKENKKSVFEGSSELLWFSCHHVHVLAQFQALLTHAHSLIECPLILPWSRKFLLPLKYDPNSQKILEALSLHLPLTLMPKDAYASSKNHNYIRKYPEILNKIMANYIKKKKKKNQPKSIPIIFGHPCFRIHKNLNFKSLS